MLECIGVVAYKLELPIHSRIYPVFHVSLFKCAVQPTNAIQALPFALTEDLILDVSPQALLDTQFNKDGNLEVLIQWQHLPSFENRWEAAATISKEFPAFLLEDKVKLYGGVLIGLVPRFM